MPRRHVTNVSSRSSSPVCHCVRPRPVRSARRRPVTAGAARRTRGVWRRALSRRRPPPMHAVARRGPRANGAAAGARPARAGRKRPDEMRWAVRGVATRAGQTARKAAPRRNPLRVIGLQDNNRRRARGDACRAAATWRLSPGLGAARVGHTPSVETAPGGRHDTPARRKEAVDPHHPDASARRESHDGSPGGPRRAPHRSGGMIPAQGGPAQFAE